MPNSTEIRDCGTKIRLLIVEDQIDLAENLFEFLGEERYVLDFSPDGLTALHLLATHSYDVVVLDLMLPGVNGFELCRRIRADLKCKVPIILTTALGSLADKEKGFSCGADDYLVKPFELRELQLRIEALYRRSILKESGLRAGSVSFDPETLTVELYGKSVQLTGIPAKIFELLIGAYPKIISHEVMHEAIWGEDGSEHEGHSLRTHIYALRKILQSNFDVGLIKTVHGRGYQLITIEKKSAAK
ncbi:response regulator transcription factor [Microbulbifer sp. TYP-18]|uniref:response regulator transcription factor n=1 Tax=Microbulbifer sp. TYP-18 TaxID=3230024 RepID=UPI0034C6B0B8